MEVNVNSGRLIYVTPITESAFNRACYKKVKVIKDRKLAETNFKILHNILPCNLNLHKWKLRLNNHCNICGDVETIRHLLFECVYVKDIWKKVETTLGCKLTLSMVLFGLYVKEDVNYVISIILHYFLVRNIL